MLSDTSKSYFGLVVRFLLLAVVPSAKKTVKLHNLLSFGMGLGMLGSALLFGASLTGNFQVIELMVSTVMGTLSVLTFTDEKHYIFYELAFIYLAHISILVAAVELAS